MNRLVQCLFARKSSSSHCIEPTAIYHRRSPSFGEIGIWSSGRKLDEAVQVSRGTGRWTDYL